MVRRRLLLTLCLVLWMSIASWSVAVLAQGKGLSPLPLGAPPQLLLTAMRTRIAVSFNRHSGRTIPAAHCRHAPGGCEKRLAAFAEYLVDAAEHHSLDPWLMAAMAFKESGFNPFALGSLGEMGILQINPGRKDARQVRFMQDEWYRKRCRKEPGACQREVVEHAATVLERSFERCNGDVVEALGAYNTGHCGGNRSYAKGVLITRNELRTAAGYEPEVVNVPKRRRERSPADPRTSNKAPRAQRARHATPNPAT